MAAAPLSRKFRITKSATASQQRFPKSKNIFASFSTTSRPLPAKSIAPRAYTEIREGFNHWPVALLVVFWCSALPLGSRAQRLSWTGIGVRKELTKRRNSRRIVPRQALGEASGIAMSGSMESASMGIHTRGGGRQNSRRFEQTQGVISHP
jgi:hypothetical protein